MTRLLFYGLVALGIAAPQIAQASPILSLMSEKGISIIEKISIGEVDDTTGSLGDDDLQVVFGAGDLSDYKLLKKKVKKKLGKLQKRGGSKARLRIDGVGLDLDGKLRARQLKRLAKDLRGMKGSFTVAGIPEPGTLMLLASGLAGLGLVNRHLSRRD